MYNYVMYMYKVMYYMLYLIKYVISNICYMYVKCNYNVYNLVLYLFVMCRFLLVR